MSHPTTCGTGATIKGVRSGVSAYKASMDVGQRWWFAEALLEEPSSLNPFRAPEPLPILNPSSFVPKNGLPVVKGLLSMATEMYYDNHCFHGSVELASKR